MLKRIVCALTLLTALTGCFRKQPSERAVIIDMQLVAAYPVETSGGPDPSGLVLYKDQLYTVSDKVDDCIYRIEFDHDVVRMIPHIRFSIPDYEELDWEGISVDSVGNFHLISEEYGRILRVSQKGVANWVTPDLRPQGQAIGLFTKPNAGFEGLTLLSDEHWIGIVEREPRGMVEVTRKDGQLEITPRLQSDSPFMNTLSLTRIADYSGVDTDSGEVYALFRNAHLIVHLEKSENGWSETRGYSFQNIETDPRWAFSAQTFGQAEGLVVNGKDVYIIIDNNRGPRQADPNDFRPLLIHARIPGDTD